MSTVDTISDKLNQAQHQAVVAKPGNMLVLAGAGSGKTRTLVHRIAWLVKQGHASRHNVLAVTFTNKAANEMRLRLESLLNMSLGGMWIGTFHGIAHRFLRLHYQEAGLPETFQIVDSDDQLRLIRRLHKQLNLDEVQCPPQKSQWFINSCKDDGKRPGDVNPNTLVDSKRILIDVYSHYERQCEQSGVVDFAELLLRSYETLSRNEVLLKHYQSRFQQVVVDEFQDTNTIQYEWLRLLSNPSTHIMAVGDDDQSIYSWRGAQSDNLKRFQSDFDDVSVIVLSQNYRSTSTILNVANQVISQNKNRIGKALWTDSRGGELVSLFQAHNEFDEARFIVNQIRAWSDQGNRYDEAAILYRSNMQSRVLEEALRAAGVPYRVHGGQRFFERAEIKDALAYIRLLLNRNDDSAFERVVNLPARGLGLSTLGVLRGYAQQEGLSLWQSAVECIKNAQLGARPARCLQQFLLLIDSLDQDTASLDIADQMTKMLTDTGLREHFKKDRTEKGVARLENLEELVTAMRQFQLTYPSIVSMMSDENEASSTLAPREQLQLFLAQVALNAGEADGENESGKVHMMTLHAAKGLEFPLVFLSGLEKGLFPHQLSLNDPTRLEEERRLCYVGMTRAKQKLFLTYAQTRRVHGRDNFNLPSPFITSIPEEMLTIVSSSPPSPRGLSGGHGSRFAYQQAQAYARARPSFSSRSTGGSSSRSSGVAPIVSDTVEETRLRIGQSVKHPKFGVGTLLNYEGRGAHARVQVKFRQAGIKWLVLSYANLSTV